MKCTAPNIASHTRSAQYILMATAIVLYAFSGGILNASEPKTIADEIHTVLPLDGIPAIFDPQFVPADEATVEPNSPMIGVSINGEQHAYSMILLNHHEIVNDTVGGEPIATTW